MRHFLGAGRIICCTQFVYLSGESVCITVLTGNHLGWTVRCGRPPLLLPSCRKLKFRLSALMDSDLAWVNGNSGRQSWCNADAF